MVVDGQLNEGNKEKIQHSNVQNIEAKIPDLEGGENSNLITENFNIGKDEAEKLLKIIRTNYPSNIDEMPLEIQDVVKYLESIAGGTDNGNDNDYDYITLSELTPQENAEMKKLVNLSKKPNKINYLQNSAYLKYLNCIECELNLPRYALESICEVESGGVLYKNGKNITGSNKGAQGLFQFMPETAKNYFQNPKLKQYYGKTFSSTIEFLKDPLATAWAAGILMNTFMYDENYGYDFQSALACYNCGPVNYKNKVGKNNLTKDNIKKLGGTRKYVETITGYLLERNSLSSDDIFADIGKYRWYKGTPDGSGMV